MSDTVLGTCLRLHVLSVTPQDEKSSPIQLEASDRSFRDVSSCQADSHLSMVTAVIDSFSWKNKIHM